MADPETQTPDLQAATGVPGNPAPMTMAQTLGAAQTPDLTGVLRALAPLQQAPNPGLAVGSGMLNVAGGGNPAMNPYLQQHRAQQNAQTQQALQLYQTQQVHMDREARRNEFAIRMLKDTIGTLPEGPERDSLSKQLEQMMTKVTGTPLGGSLATALARKTVTPEQIDGVLIDATKGYSPEGLAAKYQIPLSKVQELLQANPAVLEHLGMQSNLARRKTVAETEIKEAESIEKRDPRLRGDAKTIAAIISKHREMFNQDYSEGTEDTRQQAYNEVIGEQQAREEYLIKLRGELSLDRLIAGLQIRQQMQAEKPLPPATTSKLIEPFQKATSLQRALDDLKETVGKLDAIGALPTGEDVASQWKARLYRTVSLRGNPELFNFQQRWGPVVIGLIDRGLFDEKGVRAMQIFLKQIEAVDGMAPKAAFDRFFGSIEQELRSRVDELNSDYETLGYPESVRTIGKNTSLTIRGEKPGKPAGGPLNPEKDPLGVLR